MEYIVKSPYYNIIMKSLTLRGLLWVIGTFTSAYHNYYLSKVWDVVISQIAYQIAIGQSFHFNSVLFKKVC